MIKTTFSGSIRDLLLEDEIGNLNIFGIMENQPQCEIYVDNIHTPKGVMVKNGYMHYLYAKELSFVENVKSKFSQEGFYGFAGVSKIAAEELKQEFKIDWENPCYLYYLPSCNLNANNIKNEVKNIRIEDAEIVDYFYTYRGDESLERIKEDIENRPSSAIYHGDELVSWVLVHDDNSMGIMYTREEYRSHGYAHDLTLDLAHKLIKRGKVPFVHILQDNKGSMALAEKCGFQLYGEVTWFGIIVGDGENIDL